MLRLFAILAFIFALLGASFVYVNYGRASVETRRAIDNIAEESPMAPGSLFLIGVAMIAVGVVGKRAIAAK